MPFGTSQSAGRFQSLNSVGVNAMNLANLPVWLYLDDRITRLLGNFNTQNGTVTFLGCGMLVVLLVALGGFLNIKKSQLVPVQTIEFLGVQICSKTETISGSS